jgi:hypothetical protein
VSLRRHSCADDPRESQFERLLTKLHQPFAQYLRSADAGSFSNDVAIPTKNFLNSCHQAFDFFFSASKPTAIIVRSINCLRLQRERKLPATLTFPVTSTIEQKYRDESQL